MKIVLSRLLVAVMIFNLIGGTVTGAVGIQSNSSLGKGHEALSRVKLFAGSGSFNDLDGTASTASFRMPQGIALLKDGSVLVADTRNHLIRQVKNGEVSTYAGFMLDVEDNVTPEGAWHDGAKEAAVFNGPSGMDTDLEGNIYIADTENHRIRKIYKDGMVATVAGDGIIGYEDGTSTGARFHHPQDVAVAADGTLYVADTLNHLIRRITPDGQVTTLNTPSDRVVEVEAGYVVPAGDYADGALLASKFNEPTSIAIDHKGNLYVSDTGNQVIRYIDLAKGTVTTAAGLSSGEKPAYASGALYAEGGYADGAAAEARFQSPRGIAITEDNGLVIADSLNHTIRYLVNGHVSTIAGVTAQIGQVDGINGHNLLHNPTDVAVLPNGGLLIADSYNNKIRELEYYRLPTDLPHNDQVKVVVDDSVISFDAQPEIVKGRTMVPVRALSEKMGYKVGFLDNQTIELTKGEIRIRLHVGSKVISIKNTAADAEEQRMIEVATYTKNGRSYVPVRFFSEAFGADVQWEPNTRTVIIREITEAIDKLPRADRKSRTVVLEQIKGKVWITQAGGSLTYQGYNGMTLHQGDHIVTEKNTSAILKTVDRLDEMTISEKTELYISNLSNASHVKHTSFMLWSGLAAANVSSLVNTKDTFNILTPTAVTDVRGTYFMVMINPNTGVPNVAVFSGLVQGSGNGASQTINQTVYPAQQLTFFEGLDSSDPNVPSMIDPSNFLSLVKQVSTEVVEAIIGSYNKIKRENEEMLERMRNGTFDSISGGNPGSLSQIELDRYQNNLDNLLANMLKQARDQNLLGPEQLQALIDKVNKQLDTKIDLNNVLPLQLSDEEKQQQARQKQLAEEQKRKLEEQNKQRQLDAQKQALMDKLLAEKERQEQENKKKLEEARKQAEEKLKQQLSDAEKKKFEEQQKALEQLKQQQEQAQRPQASTPPAPSGSTPTPTNTAPKVVKPISDIMVNSEYPFEINISKVFHDKEGDSLTFSARSNNSEVVEVNVEGGSMIISPTGIGSTEISITANDGKGGLTETSFRFAYYGEIQNMRVEVQPDFIELYWDEYGEEEINYHVYMNDELIETTPTTHASLRGLNPETVYNLRVIAVNRDEEILAYADISVMTPPIYSDAVQ